MTREEKLSRDISAFKKSLQSIAEELRYFRKKDEESAAEKEKAEEPEHTCKDCTRYRRLIIGDPDNNAIAHWCIIRCCCISEDGLKDTCDDFERKENPDATERT